VNISLLQPTSSQQTEVSDLVTLQLVYNAGEAGLATRRHGDVVYGVDELGAVPPPCAHEQGGLGQWVKITALENSHF
jgi:hypothetical protein